MVMRGTVTVSAQGSQKPTPKNRTAHASYLIHELSNLYSLVF